MFNQPNYANNVTTRSQIDYDAFLRREFEAVLEQDDQKFWSKVKIEYVDCRGPQVDKTHQILNALRHSNWLFLARPPLMGKTYTVDTLMQMARAVYNRSIYPDAPLPHELENTYFAGCYANKNLERLLGTPYNLLIHSCTDVFPSLAILTTEANATSYTKVNSDLEMLKVKEKLITIYQGLQICNVLEQMLTLTPSFKPFTCLDSLCKDIATKVDISFKQILNFVKDELITEAVQSKRSLLSVINIKKNLFYLGYTHQYSEIERISHNIVDTCSNVFQGSEVNKLQKLLRKELLMYLCDHLLRMVISEKSSFVCLLEEIYLKDNHNDYAEQLRYFDQKLQYSTDLILKLNQMALNISLEPDFNAQAFRETFLKLFSYFDQQSISLFIDNYDLICQNEGVVADNACILRCINTVIYEFYACIAACSSRIKVLFITGVAGLPSKIREVLNLAQRNFKDISYDHDFYDICGFTWQEIWQVYGKELNAVAVNLGETPQGVMNRLYEMYGGFNFGNSLPILVPDLVKKCLSSSIFSAFGLNRYNRPSYILQPVYWGNCEEIKHIINTALSWGRVQFSPYLDLPTMFSNGDKGNGAIFWLYHKGLLTVDVNQTLQSLNSGQNFTIFSVTNQWALARLQEELSRLANDEHLKQMNALYSSFCSIKDSELPITAEQQVNSGDSNKSSRIDSSRGGDSASSVSGTVREHNQFYKVFEDYSIDKCEQLFDYILCITATTVDHKSNFENTLRDFIFGYMFAIKEYDKSVPLLLLREYPVNGGRIDLIVTHSEADASFVFEFKRIKSFNPDMDKINKALDVAENQINDHSYIEAVSNKKVVAIAGVFFRNTKATSNNPHKIGYHLKLREVAVKQNSLF